MKAVNVMTATTSTPSLRRALRISVLMLIGFVVLLGASAALSAGPAPGPLVFEVFETAADGVRKPIAEAQLRLGGRSTSSDAAGQAVFHGLPTGEYELRIAEPDFERVSRRVQVAPGVRQPIAMGLTRVTPVDATGRVVVAGLGQPLPGARVMLTPQKGAASMQGPARAVTDHDGRFRFLGLAPGVYRAEFTAPGLRSLVRELTIGPDPLADIALERESRAAKLAVEVVDGVSGKPLPGARITLAETWPQAPFAEAVSNAQGRASFAALQVGGLNWIGADGRVTLSRAAVTARIEAEGHVPRVVATNLSAEGEVLKVAIDPVTEQAEVEPNDALATAQAIRAGAPVRLTIDRIGDKDVFAFRLVEPAAVQLRIAADGPLQTLLRFYDGEGRLIVERGTEKGVENLIADQVLEAGLYHVEISEWGNNAADPAPLLFTVESVPAVDPREPNGELASAALLAPYEQASGLLWPRGDRDIYRVELARPGILRIDEAGAPYQRLLQLFNSGGALIREVGVEPDVPLSMSVEVAAGTHYLSMREWGDNAASLVPYRLSWSLLPDDDLGPAGAPLTETRRRLPLGTSVGATLLPTADVDAYAVDLPSAGLLRVQARSEGQLLLRIFDVEGRLLKERGVESGVLAELSLHAAEAQRVFVSVEEWGRNAWSATAYQLRGGFVAADEADRPVRNDTAASATPIASGESVAGTFLPLGDVDTFAVDVDFPGHLQVDVLSSHQTLLRIRDAEQRLIVERGAEGGAEQRLRPEVGPGRYYIEVREWGDNAASAQPFTLSVRHHPAEPDEQWPVHSGTPRVLVEGVAQAYAIDQLGDVERFSLNVAVPGKITISLAGPLQKLLQVFDARSQALLLERGFEADAPARVEMELKEPIRLILAASEWGNNNSSAEPQFIQVDGQARPLAAERVVWKQDAADPSRGWLQREPVPHAAAVQRIEVDMNGDGKPDLRLDGPDPVPVRLTSPGRQVVVATAVGAEGQRSQQRLWVDGSGPQAREGVSLSLTGIAEGQVLDAPVAVSVMAASYNDARIARLEARLDGRLIESSGTPPFRVEPNWNTIGKDGAVLEIHARDTLGSEARLVRRFRRSEYFNLTPPDGAMLTAEAPTVSWQALDFGPSKLRLRPKGADEAAWIEVVGESGLNRRVRLPNLETGIAYEFQPLGGDEAGPLRTLTRVKGLAFGRKQYAANVKRDYDQRVGVSVRNNGDAALMVRLESDQPADPLLLASFVGSGSEDKPFELAPGETREFQFAISAQNVNTEEHRIPIRIVSDNGLSDESEIVVHVRLPHVELQWSDVGPAPNGTGRLLRLSNVGDAITDLAVVPEDAHAVVLSPTVRHGLIAQGGQIDFVVTPRFYDGFKGVRTRIQALGLDKVFAHPFEMKLAPGEAMHQVWLLPGMDPRDPAARRIEAGLAAQLERAKATDLNALDWQHAGAGADASGDGKPDRWTLVSDDIEWVGSDGDGDGRVDHVYADVGGDGLSEFAAVRVGERWQATNLVEAWLEMSFALRGSRDSYKTHDVEVVLNGVTLGVLKDMLPEGNFSFRIPPGALRFDDSGLPGDNRVGLRTTHLRGGHYAVNSDFRFKFRLTATPVWIVAKSPEEARERALSTSGVSLNAPDFSLSAAQLSVDAPEAPKAGDEIGLRFPVRNLGAASVRDVTLALMRILPDGRREEQARIRVPAVGLDQPVEAALRWKIRGGLNKLVLVADPDLSFEDPDLANNEAQFMLTASGDDTPPTLKILKPTAGAVLKDTVVRLELSVDDEAGPVAPLLSIDGGLWHEAAAAQGTLSLPVLLQPGQHTLAVRVVDAAGNEANQSLQVTVERPLPEAKLLTPTEGARFDSALLKVDVAVPPDVGLVAARTAGGPWHKASLLGDNAQVELPLRFGPQLLEVMVADRHGAIRMLTANISRNSQPAAGERLSGPAAADQGLLWPQGNPGLEIDLFRAPNGVMRQLTLAPEQEASRLWDEARRRQAQGDYAGALTLYRDSLMLKPDPQTDERVRKLEAYLGIRRINPGPPK